MSKLIQEAVADANTVLSAAENRAKAMFIREFAPKVKSTLASLVNEEVSTGSDQPAGYSPETDKDAIGATVPAGQSSEDMSEKGDGPEKIKEEEELDTEKEEDPVLENDGEEEMDAFDAELESATELPPAEGEDEVLEIVNDEEPVADDSSVPAIDETEDERPEDNFMAELKKKNEALAKENRQLREAVANLTSKFKKVDLFNAKLASAFKLITQPGLSRKQKVQIAETFDAAKTVREVGLIYKTLKNSMITKVQKTPVENKNTRTVISESTQTRTSADVSRMSQLAGL